MRLFWRPEAGMPLHAADDPALRIQDSGPLLDRIDIHMEVPSVKYKELRAPAPREDSAAVRERVIGARKRQSEPFKTPEENVFECADGAEAHSQLRDSGRCGEVAGECGDAVGLSTRSHDRILKVARTIADLDSAESVEARRLSEAISYPRSTGRTGRNSLE
jgi:magnesium chelatase family protein